MNEFRYCTMISYSLKSHSEQSGQECWRLTYGTTFCLWSPLEIGRSNDRDRPISRLKATTKLSTDWFTFLATASTTSLSLGISQKILSDSRCHLQATDHSDYYPSALWTFSSLSHLRSSALWKLSPLSHSRAKIGESYFNHPTTSPTDEDTASWY